MLIIIMNASLTAACEKTNHNSEPASWDAPTTEGEMRAGQTWTRKTEMLYGYHAGDKYRARKGCLVTK